MTPAEKLRRIVQNARGDDLERCEHAFKGIPQEAMNVPYGNSGLTYQEVMDGYKRERQDWQEAADFLEQLLA